MTLVLMRLRCCRVIPCSVMASGKHVPQSSASWAIYVQTSGNGSFRGDTCTGVVGSWPGLRSSDTQNCCHDSLQTLELGPKFESVQSQQPYCSQSPNEAKDCGTLLLQEVMAAVFTVDPIAPVGNVGCTLEHGHCVLSVGLFEKQKFLLWVDNW